MKPVNRREFFAILGGTFAAVSLVPAITKVEPVVQAVEAVSYQLSLDQINAIAFAFHGAVFPEHREHYQVKAFRAIAKARQRMKGNWA